MRPFAGTAAFLAVLSMMSASPNIAAAADAPPIPVEFESPVASPHPLHGLLRVPGGDRPSPAVVLLHGCNQAALDRSVDALKKFLYATIGSKEK
ncbi:hypothetical protein LOCUS_54010 [Klebsiella pneumoniae]|uniref:hypothetical protein n=1 Tax=Klebsiella pneumoniae TaxID=573 RepID=UPI0029AFCFAE|nr:hypothetical protein LOCUS_54010 [Klebsiella pneumoniae]HXI08072.1 hypothetical protein [Bradyrhizobium sp.]